MDWFSQSWIIRESKTLFTSVVNPRPSPFLVARIRLSSEWNSRKDLFSSLRRKNIHIPAGRLAKHKVSLSLPLPALLHSSIDLDKNLLEYHFNHCCDPYFSPFIPLVLFCNFIHSLSFCGFHGLGLPLISPSPFVSLHVNPRLCLWLEKISWQSLRFIIWNNMPLNSLTTLKTKKW